MISRDRLRVLHLTRDYPPHVRGGLSLLVRQAVQALRPWVESRVFSFDDYRPQRRRPPEEILPALPAPFADRVPEVLRIPEPASPEDSGHDTGPPPDLVHVHDPLLWAFAQPLGHRYRCPVVYTVHTLHAAQNALRGVDTTLSSAAESVAMGEACRVHALSATCADAILQHYPAAGDRLRLAPAGGDPDHAAHAPRKEAQRNLPPTLLHAGRFTDLKGLDTLLEAFRRIAMRHGDAVLHLVGGVPERASAHARWERRLRSLLPPELAADRIVVERWCDTATVRTHLSQATLAVSLSRFETFGQFALEAVAYGVPLVATRVGRIGDLAPALDARQVQLVATGCERAAAQAMGLFLEAPRPARSPLDPQLRRELSWQHLGAQWVALYKDALSARSRVESTG